MTGGHDVKGIGVAQRVAGWREAGGDGGDGDGGHS